MTPLLGVGGGVYRHINFTSVGRLFYARDEVISKVDNDTELIYCMCLFQFMLVLLLRGHNDTRLKARLSLPNDSNSGTLPGGRLTEDLLFGIPLARNLFQGSRRCRSHCVARDLVLRTELFGDSDTKWH